MKLWITKDEGFTLVEGLVSLFVLSIIAISIMSAMGFSINSASNVSQEAVAVNLARERIEAIKRFESNVPPLNDTQFDACLVNFNNNEGSRTLNNTTYVINSTRQTNGVPNTVFAVNTTVTWAQNGVNRQVSFMSYYLK